MIIRLVSFLGLTLASIFLTPFIFVPLAILYAARYFAVELIVLAFLIDILFGRASDWPLYILGAGLVVLAAESAKQYLMLK